MDEHWFDNHNNIVYLVQQMYSHGETTENIVYAVEKPWKFTEEYETYREEEVEE